MKSTHEFHDLTSIGVLAGQLGVSVRKIEATCDELEIVPAVRIDLVDHFDGGQIEQLIQFLRRGQSPPEFQAIQ